MGAREGLIDLLEKSIDLNEVAEQIVECIGPTMAGYFNCSDKPPEVAVGGSCDTQNFGPVLCRVMEKAGLIESNSEKGGYVWAQKAASWYRQRSEEQLKDLEGTDLVRYRKFLLHE